MTEVFVIGGMDAVVLMLAGVLKKLRGKKITGRFFYRGSVRSALKPYNFCHYL